MVTESPNDDFACILVDVIDETPPLRPIGERGRASAGYLPVLHGKLIGINAKRHEHRENRWQKFLVIHSAPALCCESSRWSPCCFVDGVEKDERVDGVAGFCGRSSSPNFRSIEFLTARLGDEQLVKSDSEHGNDPIEHVDRRVRGAAFDIRDGLTREAGRFGERSLRQLFFGAFENEVTT